MKFLYKSNIEESQFNSLNLDPILRFIYFGVVSYVWINFRCNLVITSIYRPGDRNSVHGYWRGLDADNDIDLSHEQKEKIRDYVNNTFIYDTAPGREGYQVCVYHSVKGRGGDHLHFQVSKRTALRREGGS